MVKILTNELSNIRSNSYCITKLFLSFNEFWEKLKIKEVVITNWEDEPIKVNKKTLVVQMNTNSNDHAAHFTPQINNISFISDSKNGIPLYPASLPEENLIYSTEHEAIAQIKDNCLQILVNLFPIYDVYLIPILITILESFFIKKNVFPLSLQTILITKWNEWEMADNILKFKREIAECMAKLPGIKRILLNCKNNSFSDNFTSPAKQEANVLAIYFNSTPNNFEALRRDTPKKMWGIEVEEEKRNSSYTPNLQIESDLIITPEKDAVAQFLEETNQLYIFHKFYGGLENEIKILKNILNEMIRIKMEIATKKLTVPKMLLRKKHSLEQKLKIVNEKYKPGLPFLKTFRNFVQSNYESDYGIDLRTQKKEIKAFEIVEDKLLLYTDEIIANQEYIIGRFLIVINFHSQKVFFYNLDRVVKGFSEEICEAPHVFKHYQACFGNIEDIIYKAIKQRDLPTLCYYLIESLKNANVHDAAGGYIIRWPKKQ